MELAKATIEALTENLNKHKTQKALGYDFEEDLVTIVKITPE